MSGESVIRDVGEGAGRSWQTFLMLTSVLAIVRDKTELSVCGGVQWESVRTCL